METSKAKEEYDQAIKDGNTAYMAHYDTDRAQDKVVLMIGNLQPGVNVTITFQVATSIKPTINGDWRIVIPAALTPKFPTELAKNQAVKYNLTSAIYFNVWQKVPYSIDFTLNISSMSPLKNIRCATHEILYTPKGDTGAFISLNPHKVYQPDRDMIILFQNEEQNKVRTLIGKENYFYSVMLSFYPSMNTNSNYQQEFVLILDRSGSMDGQRIELAKKTCILFVQSLPPNSYFNIISFGSFFEKMWPQSVQYTDETRTFAIQQIQNFYANMGGTKILQPLEEIYSWGMGEIPKTIFLITDGAVSNPDAVVQLIAQNTESKGIRVHTFGIGAGVSTFLVNSAAEAGKGTASFVQENESIDDKVVNAMEIALQPYITNFKMKWNLKNKDGQVFGTESKNLLHAPKQIKFLLNKEITFIYAIIMDESFERGDVSFTYLQEGQTQQVPITFNSQQALDSTAITKLAAKSMIRELEKNVTTNKEMIIYLSTKFGILSSLTSFIAVQEVFDKVQQKMIRKNIPIAATNDYGSQMHQIKYLNMSPVKRMKQGFAAPLYSMASNSRHRSSQPLKENIQHISMPLEQTTQIIKQDKSDTIKQQPDYITLISLQKADGSFQLNQNLAEALSVDLSTLQQNIPSFITLASKNNIWATALAIISLETKYSNNESSWKLVARKGKQWLKNTGLSDDQLKNLEESAKKLISGGP